MEWIELLDFCNFFIVRLFPFVSIDVILKLINWYFWKKSINWFSIHAYVLRNT